MMAAVSKPRFRRSCRSADAHGVPTERFDVSGLKTGPFGGVLDQALYGRRAEVAVDGLALVDRTEQPINLRPTYLQPVAQELGGLLRGKGDAPGTVLIGLAATDQYAECAVISLLEIVAAERHKFGAAQ